MNHFNDRWQNMCQPTNGSQIRHQIKSALLVGMYIVVGRSGQASSSHHCQLT